MNPNVIFLGRNRALFIPDDTLSSLQIQTVFIDGWMSEWKNVWLRRGKGVNNIHMGAYIAMHEMASSSIRELKLRSIGTMNIVRTALNRMIRSLRKWGWLEREEMACQVWEDNKSTTNPARLGSFKVLMPWHVGNFSGVEVLTFNNII